MNQRTPQAKNNAAWVATDTGFEVQIDEQGKPEYLFRHRTGAIYDIPAGETTGGVQGAREQDFRPGPILRPGRWYEFEIEAVGESYTVRLGEAIDGGVAAYQEVTAFTKPGGKYAHRGLPASTDPFCGYVGIQAHSEAVAFRQIRIKT